MAYRAFIKRPFRAALRTATPVAAFACLAGLLLLPAVSPELHASVPRYSHGHTAICKWVKDAQLCNPRGDQTLPAAMPHVVAGVPEFLLFTFPAACLTLPAIQPHRLAFILCRAPPRTRVFPAL